MRDWEEEGGDEGEEVGRWVGVGEEEEEGTLVEEEGDGLEGGRVERREVRSRPARSERRTRLGLVEVGRSVDRPSVMF